MADPDQKKKGPSVGVDVHRQAKKPSKPSMYPVSCMRCLKPIGVAVPNLLCSDARYFVFGEETLNGGLVCLSVRLVFQQRGFEISSIDFSNMSKLILLDSLLQEVTMREIQIATYMIQTGLYFLIYSPRCLKFEFSISSGFKGHSSLNQYEA